MFIYNVKFICGKTNSKEFIVSPGTYTTEVNILNYGREQVTVTKTFIPLVIGDKAIGREPAVVGRVHTEPITLQSEHATFDDCFNFSKILKSDTGLKIGFLKIESPIELAVTAVYTVMDETKGVSIDVDQIQAKRT